MAHERLFDYPFDFAQYVERSLREFDNDEERKFAKAVLQEGLLSIIEANESRYKRLETRVLNEIVNESGKYAIRMTVIKREDYDPINRTLYPVLESDRKALQIADAPWEKLKEALPTPAAVLFIEADDAFCAALRAQDPLLTGKLITDHGEIPARFRLRRSALHRNRIADLYACFHCNRVPWSTLNTALLDKFFELRLEAVEGDLPDEARVREIRVDYGAYQDYIREDFLPLWNLQKVFFNSNDYPMPCIDGINYEHEFPMETFGVFDGYLIEAREEIVDIRLESAKLIVVTPREAFNRWAAYRVINDTPSRSLGYTHPVVSNAKKSSFIKAFMEKNAAGMRTKADLVRRIHELDVEEYIDFHSFALIERAAGDEASESMDWFMQDELTDCQARRILLLRFIAKQPDHYLSDAMMRFVVSTLQRDFSEYRCMGAFLAAQTPEKASGAQPQEEAK